MLVEVEIVVHVIEFVERIEQQKDLELMKIIQPSHQFQSSIKQIFIILDNQMKGNRLVQQRYKMDQEINCYFSNDSMISLEQIIHNT